MIDEYNNLIKRVCRHFNRNLSISEKNRIFIDLLRSKLDLDPIPKHGGESIGKTPCTRRVMQGNR